MTGTEPVVLIGPGWPFKGGIASHTTYLYRALRDLGPALFVSLRRQYPRWLYPGDSDRAAADLTLFEPDAQRLLTPLSPLAWWRGARAIARAQPGHIVIPWWHVFWTPMTCALLLLLRWLCPNARIIFLVHNAVGHEENRIAWHLARRVLRRGDAWIVHARSEAEKLRAMLGDVPVHYQPHPAYPVADEALPDRTSARARLSLADAPTLLFFGYVRPYKGLDTLLQALALLGDSPRCQLVVAGEIWGNAAAWDEMAEQLGISSRVRFENHYIAEDAVAMYFAAADLVVLPYRSATGSGVARLAHSHGRPALVTRTGALPDAVEEGITGYVVPAEDPAALAQAIRGFFDGTPRLAMEQAARRSARSDDWHRLARTILDDSRSAT
ncbi:MAG: glycosyltransferase [Haliea sp.]|uniref:glycosyltransferase n=1 Tax=Haliea sp. TaxID=1932666 RepID=UPI0032EC6870